MTASASAMVLGGDCLTVLRDMESESVHAIVTDPPYGLSQVDSAKLTTALTAWVSGDRENVPNGKGFMGKEWDAFVPPPAVWDECLRVLKPGGHMLVFAGSRTVDLMGLSIRLAGFEIRDTLQWLYGSGFPKSQNISKQLDKRPGADRHPEFGVMLKRARLAKGYTNSFDVSEKVIGRRTGAVANWEKYQFPEAKWWGALKSLLELDDSWDEVIAEADRVKTGTKSATRLAVAPGQDNDRSAVTLDVTSSATDAAREWEGWGTALKPAAEPIILARKPLESTVARNVLAHGTGGINVDGCRVPATDKTKFPVGYSKATGAAYAQDNYSKSWVATVDSNPDGRFPANVLLTHDFDCCTGAECAEGCPVAELDAQSGVVGKTGADVVHASRSFGDGTIYSVGAPITKVWKKDTPGGASRFFPTFRYQAKAPKSERPRVDGVSHPTVKPVALMRWLVRLITPPGGTVLDPFAGSGTTLQAAQEEGFDSIGIEREAEYLPLISERLKDAA